MTRPLRRAHGWIWAALAVLLPVLFFASLAVRRQPRGNPSIRWENFR